MPTYFVWSGTLRGSKVEAEDAEVAVDVAVRGNLPCVLGPAIRIAKHPEYNSPFDVFYEAPYEEDFPDLFDGELDVQVVGVEIPHGQL